MMNAINCKVRIKEPNNTERRKLPRQLERVIPKQMAGKVKES